MEARAQVWNDHSKEYVEKFRGDEIRIPAGGFVEMEWYDAVAFRGQYVPIIRDGLGKDLNPKMIRVVKIEAAVDSPAEKFICQKDMLVFENQKELDQHIADNHSESMVDADAKKKLEALKTKK